MSIFFMVMIGFSVVCFSGAFFLFFAYGLKGKTIKEEYYALKRNKND